MNSACSSPVFASSAATNLYNRPGLDALAYRIGDYNTFLENMLISLSNTAHPQLKKLTTRDLADPAIALLDAWAVVGDVLTFYQERIANENYLRTATERLSIGQLAQLVGYKLRPGVSASTYLAFTVQQTALSLNADAEIIVPASTQAQSIPAPGETSQLFETSSDLIARPRWNSVGLRLQQPATAAVDSATLYVDGVTANLKPNDRLLVTTASGQQGVLYVAAAQTQFATSTTKVTLQAPPTASTTTPPPATGSTPSEGSTPAVSPTFTASTQAAASPPPSLGSASASAGSTSSHASAVLPGSGSAQSSGPAQSSSSGTITPPISRQPVSPPTPTPFARLTNLVSALSAPPAVHPPSEAHLTQSPTELFKPTSDVGPALLAEFVPGTGADVYSALANEQAAPPQTAVVSAFRVSASPFGSNAPLKLITNDKGVVTGSEEWSLAGTRTFSVSLSVHAATSLFRTAIAGVSDTGQLSASASFIATVSFAKAGSANDEQESGTIAITPNQTSGTVSLGDWKVTCTENIGGGAVSSIEVQFQSASETHRFTFAETNGAMTGAVDADAAHPLAASQTIRYSLNNGRVAFTFSPPQASTSANAVSAQAFMQASYQIPETPNLTLLPLDSVYDQILPRSMVVLERPDWVAPRITQVTAASKVSIAAYGITGKVTQITLADAWGDSTDTSLSSLRQLTISAQSEALPLAPVPVTDDLAGARIELDGLYSGLTPGRWLIVQGERTDIPSTAVRSNASAAAPTPVSTTTPTPGVQASELVMLAGVEQDVHSGGDGQTILPGDTTHTTLVLSSPLAYTYARTSVSIFGNVAFATQGQSRAEILGNGDRSQAQQAFTLGQKPLTYVAATTPDGIASTLQIRVNDLLWQEQVNLFEAGPNDHVYTTQTADDTTTTVLFGDGIHGSRLSTGTANVRASYRSGIGISGNVAQNQISQLASQPLGVQGVTNPQASTGGADPESGDSARGNVAVALTALDRLVSIQDYADFSRGFAGIGKSSAVSLSDGMQQLVYVTIAGEEDIPIATDSALYLNLTDALATFGDPDQSFAIGIRDVRFLVISGQVTIDPAYDWTVVSAALRTYLLEIFGFDARSLGQPVYRSEVISAIQSIAGVSWVEIEILESVGESTIAADLTRIASSPRNGESIPAFPARQATANGAVLQRPAQLIYLNSNVPDTLILNQGGA